MSRWIDKFENHPFQNEWDILKNTLEETEVDDETVLTSVQELARLNKVVTYLDGLLSVLDPDLVPQSTWDNFYKQCAPCKQELMKFSSNRDIRHLENANNHADNLLSYVRPWSVFEPSSAVDSMVEALSEYNTTVNKYSEKYRESARDLVSYLNSQKERSESILAEANDSNINIKEYYSELFEDSEEQQSIKEKVDELVNNFKDEYAEIHELYLKVFEGSNKEASVVDKLEEATEAIENHLDVAKNDIDDIKDKKSNLEEFYFKIFGSLDVEDKSKSNGLKQELDEGMASLKIYESEQKVKHQALKEEIESLLPGATSAGLASAFSKMKESFDEPIKNYTYLFYISLMVIIVTSIVSMTKSIGLTGITFVKYSSIVDFFSSLSWKLPVVGAAIWLALFSSRRRSEAQRLQQEYAHKESFARSYNSFKKQIEELGDEDNEMLKSLIVKAVDSIAYNASATLDGKHGDKAPVQEFADKLLHEFKAQASSKE